MSKIFVSYRHADSAGGYVLSLRNRLFQRFGKWNVFLDIDRIEVAEDFVETVKTELATCQVCVVWIGGEWTTCQDERGQRRLDNPNDLVRLEVATALQRGVVIPILVNTRPPKREELPDVLRPLADLNAIEIRHTHFDDDLETLIQVLERKIIRAPWLPVLITTTAWMVLEAWVGPFFVGPDRDEGLTALLFPYLASGTVTGLGIALALWRMRRDVNPILLGLVCFVWVAAWGMVAHFVETREVAFAHPIATFPGGVSLIATLVGGLGGLGTDLALWVANLLRGWKRMLSVELAWTIGCSLSAVLLNWSSRYWSFHVVDTVAFALANAVAGAIAGCMGGVATFWGVYRHLESGRYPSQL